MTLASSTLLRLESVSKTYGGVHALEDVSWSMEAGEVHALCGENGAGKSTLIKILSGVVRPDHGTILFNGNRLDAGDVHLSERAGVAVIHQESTAFPDLNAVDNLFVGREVGRWRGWKLDYSAMREQAAKLLHGLGESINLECPVGQLPLAQRQMVSVARALVGKCRLLVMDEPTASLSARETEVLFNLIRRLRREGISVLYVSHRLEEIFSISDRITVLRDGRWVDTQPAARLSREALIQLMVGRPVDETAAKAMTSRPNAAQPPVLQIQELTRDGVFQDIDFTLNTGEVLGLGGLVGAGRSEVARAIFGIDQYDSGQVLVDGRPLIAGSIRSSLSQGLALVPEDRQHEGLVLPLSIRTNISLAILPKLCHFFRPAFRREKRIVEEQLVNLQVKCDGMQRPASSLSGGNQQKLVLGKWLATEPRVLILDEPTRGVDVGAKAQFHDLIRQFAERGMAVLVISSDLPELLALSDRIIVMKQGRIAGELTRSEATQSKVLEMALPDGRVPAEIDSHE